MTLHVLGSSSTGNGYVLLASNGDSLILEAGMPFLDALRATNYNRKQIAACFCSHVHGDHFKYAKEYIKEGVRLFAPQDIHNNPVPTHLKWLSVGSFTILPFNVVHDVPCYGYIIKHPEMGNLLFATDCNVIPTLFRNIKHYLIEANYSDKKLLLSDTDNANKARIIDSHLSFDNCKQYLIDSNASKAKTITLIHLSTRHSEPRLFRKDMEKAFGVPCNIAQKDIQIFLDK